MSAFRDRLLVDPEVEEDEAEGRHEALGPGEPLGREVPGLTSLP